MDDAVNIRGLKRYAADHCGLVPPPECCEPTGKTVAIIGGGPSGLSAAYYLQQMGHQCTIFEQRKELGGMLYYGIPNYRLPKERLAEDIQNILATGVETKMNNCFDDGDGEISFKMLKENYDAVYISIGAHTDKKLGIPGEDAQANIAGRRRYGRAMWVCGRVRSGSRSPRGRARLCRSTGCAASPVRPP